MCCTRLCVWCMHTCVCVVCISVCYMYMCVCDMWCIHTSAEEDFRCIPLSYPVCTETRLLTKSEIPQSIGKLSPYSIMLVLSMHSMTGFT